VSPTTAAPAPTRAVPQNVAASSNFQGRP